MLKPQNDQFEFFTQTEMGGQLYRSGSDLITLAVLSGLVISLPLIAQFFIA